MPDFNIVELTGISNTISGRHDAVLQRLDTLIKNNGRQIHYSSESFRNVNAWTGIPLIYVDTQGEPIKHISQDVVTAGILPDGYKRVGNVIRAYIDQTGEPALKGELEITDDTTERGVSSGVVSLSTGFSAQIQNVSGQDRIVGEVIPNHILLFSRGACPNCYPNDNSARFENTQEEDMGDEVLTKTGFVEALKEIFGNTKPVEDKKETDMNEKQVEEIKNLTAQNEKLQADLDAIKTETEKATSDAKWATMKNALPDGWLGVKEPETRTEFEADAGAFALKFLEFKNTQPGEKGAEGNENSTAPEDLENAAKIEVETFEKEYGLHFV